MFTLVGALLLSLLHVCTAQEYRDAGFNHNEVDSLGVLQHEEYEWVSQKLKQVITEKVDSINQETRFEAVAKYFGPWIKVREEGVHE